MNDVNLIKRYCMAEDPRTLDPSFVYNEEGEYWFKDNNANILCVGHFDTVARTNKNFGFIFDEEKKVVGVNSIQLDDRLGVYIIHNLLPRFGVNADILITTNEEIGQTTAANFKTEKEYNWIFEFDRRGVKPVFYQYSSNKEWVDAVNAHTETTFGSYSDITKLKHLGVCAVNWGTGYENEHTFGCCALFENIDIAVNSFLSFYFENKDKKYPYKYVTPVYRENGYFDSGYWDNVSEGWASEWSKYAEMRVRTKQKRIATKPENTGQMKF